VEDYDFGYGLYADGLKVASFAEGRIGYREWARRNGKLEEIHSIDDRVRVRLAWQRGMMHRYRGENG
jgi:hypothetical protein